MATMLNKTEYPSIGETLWTGVLPNGLSVFIVPKKGFRSCYALFGTHYGGAMRHFELEGSVCETPEGSAHYLEHKMFDMPEGENALSVLSENGADPNAFTSTDMTCYYFSCTSRFEENLRMLLKFVSTPYFTEESVEKERGIITARDSINLQLMLRILSNSQRSTARHTGLIKTDICLPV